ncbi:hypothetical protein CAEBREN_00495 [Caenorhabditis brenneri]|uniref:Receptor L-domain domain-containing protein n=1 Tax=Caenorhabditis brenneri TaxID=135651 RepID=G0MTG0_CAEBE|nr:hypothetical protein CAEBREN_00495 [Caenorhabditis brenneri]
MLSGILKILILCSSISFVFGATKSCKGDDLSAGSEKELEDLLKLAKEEQCTHVRGSIFIGNLSNVAFPVEIFKRIRHIEGSIILANNTNLQTPIHFPSLLSINASENPAIFLFGNKNVHFSIGDQFKKAINNHKYKVMFAVMSNYNVMIDTAQYNLWYLAGYPNSKFLMDSALSVKVCGENLFKPIAGILGFLFVALTVAFSTVAFYDRQKKF